MSIGVKNLESREAESTQKIILFGITTLCVLLGVALSILINIFLLEPSAGKFVSLFGAVILPVLISGYVLYYYYQHYFIRKK